MIGVFESESVRLPWRGHALGPLAESDRSAKNGSTPGEEVKALESGVLATINVARTMERCMVFVLVLNLQTFDGIQAGART